MFSFLWNSGIICLQSKNKPFYLETRQWSARVSENCVTCTQLTSSTDCSPNLLSRQKRKNVTWWQQFFFPIRTTYDQPIDFSLGANCFQKKGKQKKISFTCAMPPFGDTKHWCKGLLINYVTSWTESWSGPFNVNLLFSWFLCLINLCGLFNAKAILTKEYYLTHRKDG